MADEKQPEELQGPLAYPSEGGPRYRVGERTPPEVRHKLRLTVALNKILAESQGTADTRGKPLTLGLIIDTTHERAFGVIMAFLCIPFLLPFTIPGTSIPFGFALALLGLQLACSKNKPWLPEWLRRWTLPQKFTTRLLSGVAKLFRPLERVVRPRWLFMQNPGMLAFIGMALVLDGFYLSLPWPPVIPLTNTIPAYMALIKIIGLTEEDGVMLFVGLFLTVAATIAALVGGYLFYDTVMAHFFGAASQPATMTAPATMPH